MPRVATGNTWLKSQTIKIIAWKITLLQKYIVTCLKKPEALCNQTNSFFINYIFINKQNITYFGIRSLIVESSGEARYWQPDKIGIYR
jgi:hypothetical protein